MATPPASSARAPDRCPCGSGAALDRCCGPILRQERPAATAEQLMRSRYTAFVLHDDAHLVRSWLPSARPRRVSFVPDQQWTGLEIVATEAGGLMDSTGVVEFVAHHRRGDAAGRLHERSAFVRHEGRWVYAGAAAPLPG